MPLTVMRWPRWSPRTWRTARAFTGLSAADVRALKTSVYRRVSSAGNWSAKLVLSSVASAACSISRFRDFLRVINTSRTSSLKLDSAVSDDRRASRPSLEHIRHVRTRLRQKGVDCSRHDLHVMLGVLLN